MATNIIEKPFNSSHGLLLPEILRTRAIDTDGSKVHYAEAEAKKRRLSEPLLGGVSLFVS